MARPRPVIPVLLAATILLGGGLFLQRDRIPESFSLSSTVPFENLSKAARGADGSFAVVFDSNKRIARTGADGALIYLVPARNEPEKGFFFANEIAFDPAGNLYVASTYIDTETLTVNREAIVRFSPEGRPEAVVYALEHSPDRYTDNIGTIRSLQWTPDGLRFCRVQADGIHGVRVDPAGGAPAEETVTPLAHADDNVIYAAISADGRELRIPRPPRKSTPALRARLWPSATTAGTCPTKCSRSLRICTIWTANWSSPTWAATPS
jgi:hypothetical protein